MLPLPIISNTSIAPLPFFLTGTVSTAPASVTPRAWGGYCSIGGEFYFLFGGTTQTGDYRDVTTLQKYNPQTNTVTTLTPLTPPSTEIGSSLYSGYTIVGIGQKIYAYRNSSTMSVYDIPSDTWSQVQMDGYTTATGTGCHSVAVGNIMYIMGGYINASTYRSNLYSYDTETNTWSWRSIANGTASSSDATQSSGLVYDGVNALYANIPNRGTYRYIISENRWVNLDSAWNAGAICWNNSQLYKFGTPSVSGTIYFSRFDFILNKWVNVGNYTAGGRFGSALLTASPLSEEIYLCAGTTGTSSSIKPLGTILKIT